MQRGMTRTAHFVAVSVSEPYEGVGRALASAYSAIDQTDVPRDMMGLLDRLDCAIDDDRERPRG